MNDLNMEQLTGQYFDVLKELGNIGAGNATTALASMMGSICLCHRYGFWNFLMWVRL